MEGTRGLPPFFEIYPTPSTTDWERVRRGTGEEPKSGRETVLRPFASWESVEDLGRRVRILYPFIDIELWKRHTRWRIVPVFRHENWTREDGSHDVDTMIFPIFYWGSDPEEGSYFAVFPLGGRLRGLLGQDVIDFALFPIWASALNDGRTSTHVLWPFYNSVSGAGWSGWRIWPFWGSYEWRTDEGLTGAGELRDERWFAMWPFWIRRRAHLETQPTEITFSFPFYGRRENSLSLTRTYLWPFYVHHIDKRDDRVLHGGYFFPYRFTEGQKDFWPIFGIKRSAAAEDDPLERERFRQFAIWPIQRYDWASDTIEETERLWILPIWWDFERLDKATLETERRWKLWPLVGYRRSGDRSALDILSPFWFQRETYERLYGRLFAIFRYRSRPELTAWELLYGTLYWESGPDDAWLS
ncbi:MAG TPA: hypothetical protein VK116_10660, partial [Planctomycetota bacterium]|nr:hypothetical protein [Planctomycetota bacterium]